MEEMLKDIEDVEIINIEEPEFVEVIGDSEEVINEIEVLEEVE